MSKGFVSIIIVSSGNKAYLENLINSIKGQSCQDFEIITVSDKSYGKALNHGIDLSKGEFLLCLNDDAALDERFVERALKCFDIDSRIGSVSGKALRFDKETIDSAGLFLTLWRAARERGYGQKDNGQFQREGYVFGVNGAIGFYRKAMLDDIKQETGYFDERFDYFYEDLDIAWRAQNKGWKAYYEPNAVIYHLRGGTARKDKGINKRFARLYLNDELHKELIKNRYLAIAKNESVLGFILRLPFILIYDFMVWVYILLFKFGVVKKLLKYLFVGK